MNTLLKIFIIPLLTGAFVALAGAAWKGPIPEPLKEYGSIPQRFEEYKVILEPDKNEPEWWAGAPSVARDAQGIFWMAARMRTADAPYGLRGYEIRILRSEDGIHFEHVHSLLREDVPIPGFERPALLIDPHTGKFKLYGCGPWEGGNWLIFKWDDVADPRQFDPSTARPVIVARDQVHHRDAPVHGYKDPVIIYAEGAYHAYLIGQHRRLERLYHFTSKDGENWEPVGNPDQPMMDLGGWHNFFVRPASVVPLPIGYLFVYEGSHTTWFDAVYNVATGLAFTFDLHHVVNLTPDAPLLASTTPSDLYNTWRYSHWMTVGDEIWVYAEVGRPNRSNEIRLFRLRAED